MKIAKTIFCIVALTLVAQPVAADRHSVMRPREFQPQQCDPGPLNYYLQLLYVTDLRQADIALSKAYQEKIARLLPAQIEALRIDHDMWFAKTCVESPGPAVSSDDVETCLKRELAKRLQFVLGLPTDQPKASYLFSGFERALLSTYVGESFGLISGMMIVRGDALRVGLRRVLAALLSKPEPRNEDERRSADDFIDTALVDTSSLEDGHYFVDYGRDPHDNLGLGIFVVDLETGETALAFIDDEMPSLEIWQKECASRSFQDESFALFQKYVLHVATSSAVTSESQAYNQTFHTPCK